MTKEQQEALADRMAELIDLATAEAKKDNWVGAMLYLVQARAIADKLERRAVS